MFTTLIVIYMLIFIHNAFRTSTPTNFIFCWVYKVFCISVSVISKLVYSVILCPCIIIIRIHSKKSKQMSKSGFFLPDRMLVWIQDFQAKPGESRRNRHGWTVCTVNGDANSWRSKTWRLSHFHQPNPPSSQPIDPVPNGNAAIIQKIATTFQELFKDYIRFSRKTY